MSTLNQLSQSIQDINKINISQVEQEVTTEFKNKVLEQKYKGR